jgi:hypothetical protein
MSKNPKTAIQEIKKLMVQFGFMSDEPVLASFKTEDNTILETLELKVGSKITKVSEEFERVSLESGKYKLVENFEIEVKDGEIKSVKQIFVDAKLVDGTQIKVEGESLMEGARVVVVMADGEVPAPDGVHELEDGTKVETKEGVIARIEEKEAPEVEIELADEMVEGPKGSEAEVSVPDPMDEFISLVKDMMEKISEKMKSMEEKVEEVKSEFSSFKKEPAGKKISDGKTDFNKQFNSDDTLDAKIAAITAMRKK